MVLVKLVTFPSPPDNGPILLEKGGGDIMVSGYKPKSDDKCFVLILLLVLKWTGVRLVILGGSYTGQTSVAKQPGFLMEARLVVTLF